MNELNKFTAFIPMRHSSERVPGKNYRDFAGKPLFYHITESLLKCKLINKVVIDSDSDTIAEMIKKDFPDVTFLRRPEHLKDGTIPMNDILLNLTNQFESQFYIQTHSTNPILKSDTITNAIETFLLRHPTHDSLFTVSRKNIR